MSPQFKTAFTPTRKFQSRLGKNESFDWIRLEEKERNIPQYLKQKFPEAKKNTKKQQNGTGCFSKFFGYGFKRKDVEAGL